MEQDQVAENALLAAAKERQAARAQSWIARGATAAALGIALSLTEARGAGGFITLLGLAACLTGLHRYGRSGPRAAQ